jgi:hypothetical protein
MPLTIRQLDRKINEIESQYPDLHIDLDMDIYLYGDAIKLQKLYKLKLKLLKQQASKGK